MNLMLISTLSIVLYCILGFLLVSGVVILCVVPIGVWFTALVSGAHISMSRLVGMKMRGVNPRSIMSTYIRAKKAGLTITIEDLETHFLAGGNIENVTNALIIAHSAKIDTLTVDLAKAIDLANRDVCQAVRESVRPKVIETDFISAMAKDGVELLVKTRITVKTNLGALIGGAGEDTIVARIGEGIVTTVGSAISHMVVLENPDIISKRVLAKSLDAGTAYNILSIDIADVNVGRNIGSKIRIDEADARKAIAEAEASQRKAMAAALEQEMRAKTQQMKAMVLSAQAEVPKAMAAAIKTGKIGVMDYYRMENLNSDTAMRNAIAGENKKKNGNI